MKQLLSLFLFLLPCLALAQYPSNGNQKITLGEQTTADGLIWRGVASDTTLTTKSDTAAYFVLDTVNKKLYFFKASATPKWNEISGSGGGGGSGTVTSVTGGTGLTGGTITTSGTLAADTSFLFTQSDTLALNLTSRFAAKQNTLTLTTTGTSGAATLTGATLNIPQYSGGGVSDGDKGDIDVTNSGLTWTIDTSAISLSGNKVTGTLPVANGGTGITSLGTGVATFLGTPSSANLASAVTNETGSGNLVFATQPVFTNTIGIGGATASTSGNGITFSSSASMSTDVNTLDDYEEGTWTPDLREGTTSRSPTYGNNSARYVKIGKLVYIEFGMSLTNKGSGSGSGQVTIYGLPFTSLSYGAYQEPNARYFGGGFTTESTTDDVLQVPGNSTNLRGWKTDNQGANLNANAVPYTEITNNSFFMLQMYYIAN